MPIIYRDDRQARTLICDLLNSCPHFFFRASLLRAVKQYLEFKPMLTARISGFEEFAVETVEIDAPTALRKTTLVTVTAQYIPQIYGACDLSIACSGDVAGIGSGFARSLHHVATGPYHTSTLQWEGTWRKHA